jgi:uroporphyrin-3 C-methyltransferase
MPQRSSEEAVEVYSQHIPASARQRGSALAWLSLLLALGALAAFAWQWRESERQHQEIRDLFARQARAEVRPAADPALAAGIAELREAMARAEARSTAIEQQQQALREALEAFGSADGGEWALAEAEYLQRLAGQTVLMGREPGSALALLEASDAILAARDDPALHEARAQLARDAAALRAVQGFDVEGLYLRLAALGAATGTLVFAERRLPRDEPAAVTPAGEGAGGAWQRLQALLSRLVVVSHDAPAIRPLPALADEQLLRMNLRLALEQAKLALLAAEPAVYAGALGDAEALVRAHFGAAPAPNRAFLEELSRLAAEPVAPALPDISGSLRALRAATRHPG